MTIAHATYRIYANIGARNFPKNEMASKIEYTRLESFFLDPRNPRLGRANQQHELSQDEVYERMCKWSLEELATSFLESEFWSHEAVICCWESVDGEEHLVVIEGNRRIAALKRLQKVFNGEDRSRKWLELIKNTTKPKELFEQVPYIRIDERTEANTFLGFRHVTGIKQWAPPEKAQFIAHLIDNSHLSYRQVMRKIGSQTQVVERNYIAHCILMQMEEIEDIDISEIEDRFSLLFLSIRSKHIQGFLGISNKFGVIPSKVRPPVDLDHIENLKDYALWLFGNKDTPEVVKDSRDMGKFAIVLSSEKAVDYLKSVPRPSLEKAYIISGGSQDEIYELVSGAVYSLQEALSSIHLYKDDEPLIDLSKLLIAHTEQIRKTLGIKE